MKYIVKKNLGTKLWPTTVDMISFLWMNLTVYTYMLPLEPCFADSKITSLCDE
jgi:hypothetical protein